MGNIEITSMDDDMVYLDDWYELLDSGYETDLDSK